MVIFTAAATLLLAGTFLAGNAIAIGIVATGLAVATQIGVSYAIKAISGKQDQPSNATDSFGVQGTLAAGGDVPRQFPLGFSSTGGQLVYANYHGGSSQTTPNAYLTWVIKLSDLPGCRLLGFWVNGERVTLPVGGLAGPLPGIGYEVPDYVRPRTPDNPGITDPHLYINFYNGTQTTADPFLVGQVSSNDRPYENTRIGRGCAYAIVTALSNDSVFPGFPQFKFELSSIPLYDVSKDSTAGGSGPQRYSDPSTWGGDGDDLTAVQIYNILRGIHYEGKWVYGLQNMTAARLPASNWVAQIQKCRDAIEGENGLEPTYRSGGQINVNTQPMNAIKAYLMACQGRVSEIAGFFKVHLGAPDSPVFSFTDADIVSVEPQTFNPFRTLAVSVNGIQARYPDPAQGWAYDTAPAYYRTDLERRDGNRRLMATPQFDMVPYAAQVQRLQKSAIEDGQRARSHTLVLPPAFWVYEPGDVGVWTSARNRYSDKHFRIDVTIDKANLDSAMTITEVDPGDFDWDHGTDFKPVTTGPTVNVRPAPQGVVDWFVEGASLYDAANIARRPAIRLAWDGAVPGVVGVQYEIRLAADHSDVTKGRTDQLAAGAIIVSQSILPNTAYQARGQYIPSSPRDMLWSDWLSVTTPDVRISLLDFDAAVRAQVTAITDALNDKIDNLSQVVATIVANEMATNWLDKKQTRRELHAVAGNAAASIAELQTVVVNNEAAFAAFETEVTATFGAVNASVTSNSSAIATLKGFAAAQWAVTTNVNGHIVGINLFNGGGGTSAFVIMADKIQFASPGVNGGAPVPFLTTGTIAGVPSIGMRGNFVLDGEIKARMLSVGTLSAISADLGTVNAGIVQGTTGKMTMNLNAGTFIVAD